MTESPRKPRPFLRATLIAVPLALLMSAGFLHAQHVLHHDHPAPAAQAISVEHVHAMLAKVGASSAQQQRIDGLLATANSEMQGFHEMLGQAHHELARLLLAPAVDRALVEALRTRQIVALDAASRRLLATMEEAVEVLTPEQRATLRDLHQPHGG